MTQETQAAQADPLDEYVKEGFEAETPVEEPTEAPTDQAAESAPAEAEAGTEVAPTDDSPTEPDGVQKRINKITADKHAEKRRADALQDQLDKLKQAPVSTTEEPKLENFDYDQDKHNEALVNWKVENRLAEQTQVQQQQAAQAEVQQVQKQFAERSEAFAETTPDYAEVLKGLPELPQDVFEAVLLSEDGPQLAYHLATHLDVVDSLANDLPQVRLVKLGQISAGFKAVTKPTVKPSAAPEPIKPVSSGASASKEMEDMSMDEIMNL